MSCNYATWDAAYVLGSLSPTERAEFESHLSGCEECARAVRELAGLPGLLARVPADVATPEREPVPATLLPGLVGAARKDQRRRVVRTSLVAAAAVAAIAAGSVGVAAVVGDDDVPAADPPAIATADPEQLHAVGTSTSTGWVSLTSVDWGTRLDLTCTYQTAPGYGSGPYAYVLVVRTSDGRLEETATWDAIPGKELHVTGAASVQPEDITAVEVQTLDGHPVLRLRR